MRSKLIKALAMMLSIITILSAISSCGTNVPDDNVGDDNNNQQTNDEAFTDKKETQSNDKGNDKINNSTNDSDNDSNDSGMILYANGKYNAQLIKSASANTFDNTFYNKLCSMIKFKTTKAPTPKTDYTVAGATRYDGPAVLIGQTVYDESAAVYKTLGANQAKAVFVGNKYVIAYSNRESGLLIFKKINEIFNECAKKSKIVINEKWNIDVTVDTTPAIPQRMPSLVIGVDQRAQRAVLYDLDAYAAGNSLDSREIWSISIGHAADAKYRENSVFGNVVVVSGTKAGIYKYPSKETVWSTTNTAQNPHSIELLPSGNVVIASSTDGKLRLFKTAALRNNDKSTANSYTDYSLPGAHGVLWDPTYKVLWAIGDYHLKAYKIQGSGKNETLVEDTSKRISLPTGKQHGHDLSPDYTDTRYLYITTNACVMKVDKSTLTLIPEFPNYTLLNATAVKGFSNNASGSFFFTGEAGGAGTVWDNEWYESWCTDSIYYVYRNDSGKALQKVKLTSTKSAFYKTRVFCGSYQ